MNKYMLATEKQKEFYNKVRIDLYNVFDKVNINSEELNKLLKLLSCESVKTPALINDLSLCVLIKYGFNRDHVKMLSKIIMKYNRFSTRRVLERLTYLKDNVVDKITYENVINNNENFLYDKQEVN